MAVKPLIAPPRPDTAGLAEGDPLKGMPGIEDLKPAGDPTKDIPGVEDVGTASPPVGPLNRVWQRMWGTDVPHDPQQLTRLGSVLLGSITGSMVGAEKGGVAGGFGGGVLGAVTGAVLPETTMKVAEMAGLLPKGYTNANGLSWHDLQTVVMGEGLLETATGGGVTLARLGRRGLSKWITGSRGTEDIAEAASREGIAILPVQLGSRKLPRQFISIFGRFPLLATPFAKQAVKADQQLADAFERVPGRIAPAASMNAVSTEIFADASNLVGEISRQFESRTSRLFMKADAAGVKVAPINTSLKAREMLTRLEKMSPAAAKGQKAIPLSPALQSLKDFLTSNIMPMAAEQAPGLAKTQSLRQLDSLLQILDMSAKNATKGKLKSKVAYGMIDELRTTIQSDMLLNSRGANAKEVISEFMDTDAEFSRTLQDLFNNGALKKLGIKADEARGVYIDPGSKQIDDLANVLLKSTSSKIIDDLERVVQPYTFRRLTSTVLNSRLRAGMTVAENGVTHEFNIDKFAELMGLDQKGSPLYLQTAKMLEKAGGMNISEVNDLVKIARRMGSIEIPDVSTFVARRGVLGGVKSVLGALIPGAAVVGGAHLAGMSGIFTGLLFVGGTRSIAKLISDPLAARMLRSVTKVEGRGIARKASYIRIGRAVLNRLFHDEGSSPEANVEIDQGFKDYMEQLWGMAKEVP